MDNIKHLGVKRRGSRDCDENVTALRGEAIRLPFESIARRGKVGKWGGREGGVAWVVCVICDAWGKEHNVVTSQSEPEHWRHRDQTSQGGVA